MMGKGIRMKKHKIWPKCPPIINRLFLKKESGVVLLITLLLMFGIAVLGLGVVVNANLNASVAKNYVGKLQSFYAADAQVSLLAQECFDGNADKYFSVSGCSAGNMITSNCDFSSGSLPTVNCGGSFSGWAAEYCTGGGSDPGGNCTGSISGGQAHLHITAGGTNIFDCELAYHGLNVVNGGTYRVRLDTKAAAKRLCDIALEDNMENGPISQDLVFWMSDSLTTSSFDFFCNSTQSNAALCLQAGAQDPVDISFDNVFIKQINNDSNYNFALTKAASVSASSIQGSGYEAAKAIDANTTTRWSSAAADNQYVQIDLGRTCLVQEVVLKWEAAYATNYEILLSTDGSTWYQAYQNMNGQGNMEVISFSPQDVRYVRMHGISRAWVNGVQYGFSLWEFEVYGSSGGRYGSGKTYIGEDSVSWAVTEVIPSAAFNIVDTTFKKFASTGRTFTSQLAQYVELPTGGLVNPYGAVTYIHDTMWDFHSDRSNPEFEMRHYGQLRAGMVGTNLSSRKPVVGTTPYLNYGIGRWFKTWSAPDRNNIPTYTYGTGDEFHSTTAFNGYTNLSYDTTFKNVPFADSLPFTHIGNGMYQYSNDNFFPLDNRGFGNEWNYDRSINGVTSTNNHNYSFTMQIQSTFTKVPGQTFYFSGDDDVWVFIGGKLVMDLGGVHQRTTASFLVDTISGLVTGNTYNLDFFYCERHSVEAHCQIITNLLTYHSFTQQRVQWKRSYGNTY
jgi:fibro-slime domain-containing protein